MNDVETFQKAYRKERSYSDTITQNNEESAVQIFCQSLAHLDPHISYARLDTLWADNWPLARFDTSRGCPDYVVHLSNYGYLYLEIKINKEEIEQTIDGIMTHISDVHLPKYGCSSYYLDKDSIFKNMHHWTKAATISAEHVLVLFQTRTSEQYCITLTNLTKYIKKGWNSKKIAIFGENYGKGTYLIPKDATISPARIKDSELRFLCSSVLVNPQDVLSYHWIIVS